MRYLFFFAGPKMVEETFQTTFGAMFVALFLDSILYGAGILLVFQYFKTFHDSWAIGLFVGTIAALATAQVTCFFAWAYWDLITEFGNGPALILIPHVGIVHMTCIFLVSFSTQIFFARRIWYLSKREQRIWLCSPVVILALLQISTGIALTTKGYLNGTFSVFAATATLGTIQSGAIAACDISITFILCHILNKSRSGMGTMDGILDKMIIYTINRGAITSFAALLSVILFATLPGSMVFMCASVPSGQLYVISVTATLLARKSLLEDMARSRGRGGSVSSPLSTMQSGVHVSTSVITWGASSPKSPNNGPMVGKVPPTIWFD